MTDSIDSVGLIEVESVQATNPALYRLPGKAVLLNSSGLLGEFQTHGGELARWNVNTFTFTPWQKLVGRLLKLADGTVYQVQGDGALYKPADADTVEDLSDDIDAVSDEVATKYNTDKVTPSAGGTRVCVVNEAGEITGIDNPSTSGAKILSGVFDNAPPGSWTSLEWVDAADYENP